MQFSKTIIHQASIRVAGKMNVIMFVLTFSLACIISILYVTHEHVFYWWDYADYQDYTNTIAHHFSNDALYTLAYIFDSTQYDYNAWFTLPLIPFVIMGQFSRLSYILGITVVYMYPFALVLGSVATALLPGPKEKMFWLAVAVTICMPMSWIASFRGYPDIGGALLLALALLFYLRDSYLQNTKSIIVISFLLALAMIFRRHFTYGALGFIFAVFLYNNSRIIAQSYGRPRDVIKTLFYHNLRIVAIPVLLLTILFVSARPFFYKLLLQNFTSLYSSYMVSPQDTAYFFLSQFGIFVWVIAIAAVLSALIRKNNDDNRKDLAFIGILALVLFAQWVGGARQMGIHYALQFIFFPVIGICSCMGMLARMRRGVLLSGLLLVGIVLNLISGLTNFSPLGNGRMSALMAAKHPPLQHPDYAEIQNIIRYLHQNARHGEPIFVAASSDLLNFDILRHADATGNEFDGGYLNFLGSPQVDSRDFYPLEELMDAQFVVVAVPFQHHLAPQEQDVVHVVVDAFITDWPIVRDFEQLDSSFQLSNHVVVTIFQRVNPTSLSGAVQTLRRLQEYMQVEVPARQPDWIAIDGKLATVSSKTATNTTRALIQLDPAEEATLLFSGNLPGNGVVDGFLADETSCSHVSISLLTMDEDGNPISKEQLALDHSHFRQVMNTDHNRFVALVVSDQALGVNESCTVVIDPLVISSQ